jgi:YD repeat-containing protein
MVNRPGRKGFYADFRVGGRRIQKKLGTDFKAACQILIELKARAQKSEFGLLDNDYPLTALRDAYLKRCVQELRPNTVAAYRISIDKVLSSLGVHKVRQVTVDGILTFRERRLLEVCPRTVNRDVDTFTFMLRWGADKKLIGSNPLQGIKPLPHDRPKQGRALADDEVTRLLQVSSPHRRDIWYAFLVTGVRDDELASLLFTDIDWPAREIIIRQHNAKGKRERRIPIEDGLWEILNRQQAGVEGRTSGTAPNPRVAAQVRKRFTRDHVFVTTRNTPLNGGAVLYKAFMRCCDRAGIETHTYDAEGNLIEHVDLHSLRRTFATNAIVNGADPNSVREILGHTTLEMTMKIYAKVRGATKRQAIGKLSYAAQASPPEHLLPLPPAANE